MFRLPKSARLRCLTLAIAFAVLCQTTLAADDGPADLSSFLLKHCAGCHQGDAAQGMLDLRQPGVILDDPVELPTWIHIHDRVARGEMPPKEEPRPDATALQPFLEQLAQRITRVERQQQPSLLRRLNRVEYEHTVRDLFGIQVDLKDLLPEDPVKYGFDTIAEALAFSPEHMEAYLQAADRALAEVLGADRPPPQVDVDIPLGQEPFLSRHIDKLFLRTDNDELIMFQDRWCPAYLPTAKATAAGTYRVRLEARTYLSRQPLVLAVYGGDVMTRQSPVHLVGYYDVPPGDDWTTITFEDYLEPNGCFQFVPYGLQAPKKFRGPGLVIGKVSVTGPLEAWPPRSRTALLEGFDATAPELSQIRQILLRLLPRAFRRPVEPQEVEPFVSLAGAALDEGRSFQAALTLALKGVLCSSDFLMREAGCPANRAADSKTNGETALASRMSYFLWSSLPDQELLSLASTGTLHEPNALRTQTERMLQDPKSARFVESFTGQWLGLRNIRFTEPDAKLYPEFDEMLRHSLVEETRRFFQEILDRNLSLLDFADSDWTILNERLAGHYEITGVHGQAFRRVTLPAESPRGGILGQASWLKVTANGTTTSPVVRGVWVLENLLGKPTPPPPRGVPAIEPDIRGAVTVREQLEKHRSMESCAVCHRQIDPFGLALENFDPIGNWRRWYRTLGPGYQAKAQVRNVAVSYRLGRAVDAQTEWPDGEKVQDIRDVKRMLRAEPRQITRCLTEKLLTYALGRPMVFSDRPAIEGIVSRVEQQNYGFRSLVQEVVLSPLFTSLLNEPATP